MIIEKNLIDSSLVFDINYKTTKPVITINSFAISYAYEIDKEFYGLELETACTFLAIMEL